MLAFAARSEGGATSVPPDQISWRSSNAAVARVSDDGVVTAVARGVTTITAGKDRVTATLQLQVRARVAVQFYSQSQTILRIAVGDSVPVTAVFVDVNGLTLVEAPVLQWLSQDPSVASVSSAGVVVGLRHVANSQFVWPNCPACVAIQAQTEDGPGYASVYVDDLVAGRPATVRFAHMATGLGPVTFVPSEGQPFTASFGESIDRPIGTGTLQVRVDGIPGLLGPDDPNGFFSGIVQEGDHLSLYVVGDSHWGSVAALWSGHEHVPVGSGLVRFVAGSTLSQVLYLRESGSPISGIAELCYFDIGSGSQYFRRAAGPFDIIASVKLADMEYRRMGAVTESGRARTYVIVGDSRETLRAVAFKDP